MLRIFIILFLSCCFMGCANTPNSLYSKSQVQQGKRLFEQGYYRQAMKQLLPLACDGNAEAEYAVGYMYYYGYGVPQDTDVGSMWIERSAKQGYCPAQEALRMIEQDRAADNKRKYGLKIKCNEK